MSASPGVYVAPPTSGGIYVDELPSFAEGFDPGAYMGTGTGPGQLRRGPGFRPVTSSRRDRALVDDVGWDERPPLDREHARLAYPEYPPRAREGLPPARRRAAAAPVAAPAAPVASLLGPDGDSRLRTLLLILILVVLAFILGGQVGARGAAPFYVALREGGPPYPAKREA